MKTNKLPLIGFERFKKYPEYIIYLDDNIAVLDNISSIMETNETASKMDCFMVAFCQEGSLNVQINGKNYQLDADYCAILPPGTIIRKMNSGESYVLKIAVASQDFLNDILSPSNDTCNVIRYLYNNPIFPISPKESYKMYLYKELLMNLVQEVPHAYSKQTRRYHFAGMFCEMMAALNKQIPEHERSDVNRNRSIIIARDFIQMVNADNGSHRSVSYYADRLFYSPKYLCTIVRQVTGKTPIQIINEHAIKEIKQKLKNSDLSIKEIADYFDFSNPSFFGKYVKNHLGISPLQYRLKEEDK
jgi:AraC-like DNA-binding protein